MTRTERGRRYSGLDAAERTRQRRRALLDAALESFGDNGYTTTTVKQICRSAELTERYFYESFRDRHACLVAVYGELADAMLAAVVEVLESDRPLSTPEAADEQVGRALTAFIGYLAEDPRRARVVLIEVVGVSADLEQRRHDVLRRFAEMTATLVLGAEAAAASGRLTAVGLVGGVNHLLVDWLMRGRPESPAELVDVCLSIFSATRERLAGDSRTP